ncbi:hypothetical protein ACFXO9_09575 [Nocardia tengchongensis]|uniref:phage tail fiber protein n=1 Tax=Nocardia tengchongensis TaxID=2055889 RepID=UPI0036740829
MSIIVPKTQQILAQAYANINAPTGMFLAIHNADPGQSGTPSTEAPSTNGYARKPVTWNPVPAGSGTATAQQVNMTVPAGAWTYAALWDAATGGNMIDRVAIGNSTFQTPSTLLVTPSFTIS